MLPRFENRLKEESLVGWPRRGGARSLRVAPEFSLLDETREDTAGVTKWEKELFCR